MTEWKPVDFSTKNSPMLSNEEYDQPQLNPDEFANRIFCCLKRWIKDKLSKTGKELYQRLIVPSRSRSATTCSIYAENR